MAKTVMIVVSEFSPETLSRVVTSLGGLWGPSAIDTYGSVKGGGDAGAIVEFEKPGVVYSRAEIEGLRLRLGADPVAVIVVHTRGDPNYRDELEGRVVDAIQAEFRGLYDDNDSAP